LPKNLASLTSLTDLELVAICVARPINEEAWGVFYNRYLPFVYGRVKYHLSLRPTEISDVVQDAFLRIFQVLPRFDPHKASPKTFMSEVITNLVIDFLRHGSELRAHSFSLEGDTEVLQLCSRGDPGILHQASQRLVDRLKNRKRIGLVEEILRGTSVNDIRRKYQVSKDEVYAARRWVRIQLRELSNELPEY
jgi:RNA polymerase sigma factor (sigma-70 family)